MQQYIDRPYQPKYKIRLFEFLLTFSVWVGLTWSLEPFSLFFGILVALVGVLLLWDLFPPNMALLFTPKRILALLLYAPYFIYCVIHANLDVAYRVLHPDMPIKPGIVKVKTTLKTDLAKTFLANSITLTPGTLTVDIDGEYLYIHWIYVISEDMDKATKIIVSRFEYFLRRIFE